MRRRTTTLFATAAALLMSGLALAQISDFYDRELEPDYTFDTGTEPGDLMGLNESEGYGFRSDYDYYDDYGTYDDRYGYDAYGYYDRGYNYRAGGTAFDDWWVGEPGANDDAWQNDWDKDWINPRRLD